MHRKINGVKPLSFKTPFTKTQNKQLKADLSEIISSRLRQLREEKKMTQEDLSMRAGLHLTYVGHLELGKYHPSVFVLWKIAQVLQVSLDELVS